MPAGFLRRLFENLDRHGVEYCVLRNYDGLPERPDGDVDLLVGPGRQPAVERIIRGSLGDHVVVRRGVRNDHLQLWVCGRGELEAAVADDRPAASLELDIVTSLASRGVRYLDTGAVLAAREKQRDFWIATETHRAVHLACHGLLDKDEMKPSYAASIAATLRSRGDAALEPLVRFAGAGVTQELARFFRDETTADHRRLRRALARGLFLRRPAAAAGGAAAFRLRKVLRIGRALAAPPGLLVATAGPDGSGKSTLIARVRTALAATFDPVLEQYMGWKQFLLPTKRVALWLLARTRRGRAPDAPPAAPSGGGGAPDRSWTHNVSVLHYLADLWVRYLLRIRPALCRGGLVVCDRYFYDVLTQGVAVSDHPVLRSLLLRMIPRPTVAVLFAGDPAVIAARKGELSPEETAAQQKALAVLASRPHVLVVQASETVETNAGRVLERLFRVFL